MVSRGLKANRGWAIFYCPSPKYLMLKIIVLSLYILVAEVNLIDMMMLCLYMNSSNIMKEVK